MAQQALLAVLLLANSALAATYYTSPTGNDKNAGTDDAPFRTIQRGVHALAPGDTLLIQSGTYRESIAIGRSGTELMPITIAAAPGAKVIITGSDPLPDGWTQTSAGVYEHAWNHLFAIDYVNGKPVLSHPNDAHHKLIGRAEQVIHNGKLLRQVLKVDELLPGTFLADTDAKKLYVHLPDSSDPAKSDVEASVRPHWLVGQNAASYIHVRGITFRYAANHAQRGALALEGDPRRAAVVPMGWIVADCVFEWTSGAGVSLWGKDHLLRRCLLQDNGQLGLGADRCHDTLVEECGIYRNNLKGFSIGWEAGGTKICLSRGFALDRCRVDDNHGPGVWFDIGCEKGVVRNCGIAGNDSAGIFYEISYGLHAHDNILVNNGKVNAEGDWGMGGITLSSSEDCRVENNTLVDNRDGIDFREQPRTTPRIDGGRGGEVRIFNHDHVISNNIIAGSRGYTVGFWMDVSFFGFQGDAEKRQPISADPRTLNIRLQDNILFPARGGTTYLYGVPWRDKARKYPTVAAFTAGSGIADSSVVADPQFVDAAGGDYRTRAGSAAEKLRAGVGRAP